MRSGARMMARGRLLGMALASATLAIAAPAVAQPVDLPIPPATTATYPPGVKVATTPSGSVYTDAKGRTLYGMDMRMLLRWAPDPAQHCQGACAETWEPLLAPAGSKPNVAYPHGNREAPPEGFVQPQKAPDWTIIAGPQGPQWVYKGWHVVFTRKGDQPGSTAFDGSDDYVWNTLKFVPPAPEPVIPGNVSTVLVDGSYAFADADGRVLFAGNCGAECTGWTPLPASLASRGRGEWSVSRQGDVPQWLYRGKPVFVTRDDDKISVPTGAEILRP
jgi:predicted lipoprotein with Yx(FWY)xxD motif